MKIGIGVFLLLVVLLIASPFYVGMRIENGAQQQIESYQASGFGYTLNVDRGYRRSTLTYGIAAEPDFLTNSYGMSASEASEWSEALSKVQLPVHVEHGPILTENGFGLGWTDLSARWDKSVSPDLAKILEHMNVDEFFTANSRVSLTGNGDFEFSSPRMGYVDPDTGDNLRFNGMSGQGTYSGFGRAYSIDSRIQGAIVAAEFAYIAIGPVSLNADVDMHDGYQYWADIVSELGLESIIYSSELTNISISNMQISANLEDGETTDVGNMAYVMEAESFGSGSFKLQDIEASFAYTDLNKQFFEEYAVLATSLSADEQEVMVSFIEAQLPAVLAAGPGFAMPKLAFSHEDRTFEAEIELAIDGQKVPEGFSLEEQTLFGLVPALSGQLHLDADESLVNYLMQLRAESSVDASLGAFNEEEITPEMRQSLIDRQATAMLDIAANQGFVIKENGRIQAEIGFADAALDVNGTAMRLPFF